jgi:hypothetical protein
MLGRLHTCVQAIGTVSQVSQSLRLVPTLPEKKTESTLFPTHSRRMTREWMGHTTIQLPGLYAEAMNCSSCLRNPASVGASSKAKRSGKTPAGNSSAVTASQTTPDVASSPRFQPGCVASRTSRLSGAEAGGNQQGLRDALKLLPPRGDAHKFSGVLGHIFLQVGQKLK